MLSRMPVQTKKPAHSSWPPPPSNSETVEERRTRLKKEADAKYKSDSIDRQLCQEREERQKKPAGIQVLLLGQAESGKSTVLKNFQLHLSPKAFKLEAELWRPVIQLNLVQSVNYIIAFISNNAHPHHQIGTSSPLMSPKLRTLCLRLAPLRRVEEDFVRILSSNGWKRVITPHRRPEESTIPLREGRLDEPQDGPNRRVLVALGEDIAALWHDESLQQSLKSTGIDLEEQPGFFLDHAIRVTRENYKPRPDDVLRARVTTVGPETHIIATEGLSGRGKQWTIYDVGGSLNQRAATWAQFFDDVNAIIFLAPLSGFNQFLDEDKSINRLTDSLRLWQVICSNRLLASVGFVLFLNKVDILDSKLKSGIQFSSFVPSYANKPNETKHVTKHLLELFVATHKQYSPGCRALHAHLTCAVDMKATTSIIERVQEIILMRILSESDML
ncbi:G-alpha-domain-containing protein [Phlegmacium glaucopus]|nr:G-alpha-domain-containing protein [Phlegmacium glaucopus]